MASVLTPQVRRALLSQQIPSQIPSLYGGRYVPERQNVNAILNRIAELITDLQRRSG